MPVLEAMACALPVVVTAGGPTDEFCPPGAGWRIDSSRRIVPVGRVDDLETVGHPWRLQPDPAHLAAVLREVAADPAERARRGAAGAEAARVLSWDAVAERYRARLDRLAPLTPPAPPRPRRRPALGAGGGAGPPRPGQPRVAGRASPRRAVRRVGGRRSGRHG